MTKNMPTLHMFCGKIASGKSTLAAKLGSRDCTVTLTEDDWLIRLFAEQVSSPSDFVRCSGKLRAAIGPHIVDLLNAGVSVVLDFQANTVESRAWMRSILDQSRATHVLHVFNVPDAVCLDRLHKRNTANDHPFAATEKDFHLVSKHFVAPSPAEGFNIVEHDIEKLEPSAPGKQAPLIDCFAANFRAGEHTSASHQRKINFKNVLLCSS